MLENVSRKTDIWGFGNHGNNFKEKVMSAYNIG